LPWSRFSTFARPARSVSGCVSHLLRIKQELQLKMSAVLKTSCRGEVRRVQMKDVELDCSTIQEAIRGAWPEVEHFTAKYQDVDGDLCTLCEATVPDFLTHGQKTREQVVFKLQVIPESPTTNLAVAVGEKLPVPGADAGLPLPAAPPMMEVVATAPPSAEADEEPGDDQAPGAWAALRGWFGNVLGKGEREGMSQGEFKGKGKGHGKCGKGWGKGGNGWKGGHGADLFGLPGVDREHYQHDAFLLRPWKLVWALLQYRAGGVLTGQTMASLVVHLLPGLIEIVAADPRRVDRKVKRRHALTQPVLMDLHGQCSRTAGMEVGKEALGKVLSWWSSASTGEALLAFFLALSSLPVDRQIAFVEEFYSSQEGRIQKFLDWAQGWMPDAPAVPIEHHGITCDGCEMRPLRGPRFTCTGCSNYDLCAGCYARRSILHGGEFCNHTFQCKPFDWHGVWLQHHVMDPVLMMHGAWGMKGPWFLGEGKGKGKGKGKDGKGCGGPWADWYAGW